MTQEEMRNLAEGKEKAIMAFHEALDKAQGFFLVLGVDVGEKTTVVGALGGVMPDDLPRKVMARAMHLNLAIEGVVPFPGTEQEGDSDVSVQ